MRSPRIVLLTLSRRICRPRYVVVDSSPWCQRETLLPCFRLRHWDVPTISRPTCSQTVFFLLSAPNISLARVCFVFFSRKLHVFEASGVHDTSFHNIMKCDERKSGRQLIVVLLLFVFFPLTPRFGKLSDVSVPNVFIAPTCFSSQVSMAIFASGSTTSLPRVL